MEIKFIPCWSEWMRQGNHYHEKHLFRPAKSILTEWSSLFDLLLLGSSSTIESHILWMMHLLYGLYLWSVRFGSLFHGFLINSQSGSLLTGKLISIDCLWGKKSVICFWFLQLNHWRDISWTYGPNLFVRYEKEGQASQLCPVDIYVSTVDPLKEPPLVTANTVLSILAVDYPVDKVSCYVSDDGAAMLTFEALSETSEFAKKWVPFCKKFSIEPRAPEFYFAQKIDYLKDKVQASFVKERRAMKVIRLQPKFFLLSLSLSPPLPFSPLLASL